MTDKFERFEQVSAMMTSLEAEIQQIDADANELVNTYLRPLQEKRERIVAAWQALQPLLVDLAANSVEFVTDLGSADLTVTTGTRTQKRPRNRRSPRSVMLNMLETANAPVFPDALAAAVKAAGISSPMPPTQLVYQTLYAARKAGYPVERNDDGSWYWDRDRDNDSDAA